MMSDEDLLSLEYVKSLFAKTEPLKEVPFSTAGKEAVFSLPAGWNEGLKDRHGLEKTDAFVAISGIEYPLTKDAALEATSIIQLTKDYVSKTPGPLVQTHLNYWMTHGDKELKLLTSAQENLGLAFSKQSIEPFSNLKLLEQIQQAVKETYGTDEIEVDYKLRHDFRQTVMRLIVPSVKTKINSTVPDDEWSVGVEVRNSLIGETPLNVSGYLFRWKYTNGITSVHATSGNYNRKHQGQGEKAFAWVRGAVQNVLTDLKHELDSLQDLTSIPLENEVKDVLESIFTRFKVPVGQREAVIDYMLHAAETDEDTSAYALVNAVSRAANHPDISDPVRLESARSSVMRIAGALPAALGSRCKACNQIPASV